MNRFHKTARRIQQDHGVRVEWAPAIREYVVDGRLAVTARKAERMARAIAREANNRYGDTTPRR